VITGVIGAEYMQKEQSDMQRTRNAEQITMEWNTRPRWKGIIRDYTADDVVRMRGSVHIEHSLARMGAEQLWDLLNREPYINALGALTGTQAVQMVAAGLKAIYVSGWQIAGDMNRALQTYPDQSLYPVDSGPNLVRRINNALLRADQIQVMEGKKGPFWFVPLIADGEAGFGGILNT
jgi:isocitrate lyase